MARKSIKDFESIIADGEARNDLGNGPGLYSGGPSQPKAPPFGFRAQTVNGTAQAVGTGWNKDWQWNSSEAPEGGPWQGGRSNRTGE